MNQADNLERDLLLEIRKAARKALSNLNSKKVWEELTQALDEYDEHFYWPEEQEEKPFPVGPHDRSWCG